MFAVEEAAPGIGVQVRDLLRDEALFLVDIGFSQTADPGLLLAGNVISLPGLSMTTGAMLPVDRTIVDDLVQHLPGRFSTATVGQFRQLSAKDQSELAGFVIHACLAGGAASYVEARDVKTGLEATSCASSTPAGGTAPSTQRPVPLWQRAEVQAVLRSSVTESGARRDPVVLVAAYHDLVQGALVIREPAGLGCGGALGHLSAFSSGTSLYFRWWRARRPVR